MAAGCQPPGFFDGMNLWEEWVLNFFPRSGDGICRGMGGAAPGGMPDALIFLVLGLLGAVIIVNVAALGVPYVVWWERRLLGRFQNRLGPNRVGKFGLLQPLADALKLMTKEDITPREADKLVFSLAPLAFAAPVLMVFAVVPWASHTVLADLDSGLLYVIAISTIGEMGVFMAGWASNNRYSLFGAMRAVALLISYEFPLVLAVASLAIMAGTMKLSAIVDFQAYIPNILFQPLGFLIFIVAISAELNRPPFDLLEAESELVTGFHTEYSGMKWGLVQMAEYSGLIAFSAIIATLFLSGWKGPIFLPGYVWILLKMGFVISAFIWVRATLPRLRVDQVMGFGWKFLLPLATINIVVTAIEVLAFPDELPPWLIPVNLGVAAVAILGAAKLLRFRAETRQVVIPGRPVITPLTGTPSPSQREGPPQTPSPSQGEGSLQTPSPSQGEGSLQTPSPSQGEGWDGGKSLPPSFDPAPAKGV